MKNLPGFPCHSERKRRKKECHVERSETSAQTIVLLFRRSFASLRMTKKEGQDDKKEAQDDKEVERIETKKILSC